MGDGGGCERCESVSGGKSGPAIGNWQDYYFIDTFVDTHANSIQAMDGVTKTG